MRSKQVGQAFLPDRVGQECPTYSLGHTSSAYGRNHLNRRKGFACEAQW